MNDDLLKTALKKNNLRITKARENIFFQLVQSECSLSAQDIFHKIPKNHGTDLASVYRNLNLFHELGLAHRFQDGTYSSCLHDHEQDHDHQHIHFISHCTQCGKKSEIKEHSEKICQLGGELKKVSPHLSQLQEVVIQGLCPECHD